MAGAETTVERLRQFLRELSPGARSLLIGELERAVLRGEEVTGADLVLQELRRIVREQRERVPRIEDSARLLFKPLEPFLVDDRGDHKHPGRVARSSLDALWNWVQRDLLPNDASALAEQVGEAMLSGDQAKTERLARVFQDRVAAAIDANVTASEEDGKARRRILHQIGTPRARWRIVLVCVADGHESDDSAVAVDPLRG